MEIGIDSTRISDFVGKSEAFYRRFLCLNEYETYKGFNCEKRKAEYAAGRWAGKEAIFKAIGDEQFMKYEILNDETGKPYVSGHPEIKISLSHHKEYAVAIALISI